MSSSYVVESNLSSLNCTALFEPEINHLASNYMVENQAVIMNQIRKMNGVDLNKVEDLFQDVFLSFLSGENEGCGYNINHSNTGSVITVTDFVFGRVKGYSKNKKYSSDGCDRHVSTKKVGDENVTVVDFEIHYASCDDSTDQENLTGMQKAYSLAKSYDNDMDTVETNVSLRQDMAFCMDFDTVVGFKFLNLFKNVDKFKSNFDESIFDKLKDCLTEHDQLKEALHNVLEAATLNRNTYEKVLCEF